VRSALAPAEVESVVVNEATRTLHVVVADEQLSLAIGRRGQNARLAAKLVGWKVDIKSRAELAREAEEKAQRARAAMESLAQVSGIGPKTAARLVEAGLNTLERLRQASAEELMSVKGVGPKTAATILATIQEMAAGPTAEADATAASPEGVPPEVEPVEPESA